MKLENWIRTFPTVAKAAEKIGVSRQRIYQIIKGEYPSRKLALRIEELSGGKVSAKKLLFK